VASGWLEDASVSLLDPATLAVVTKLSVPTAPDRSTTAAALAEAAASASVGGVADTLLPSVNTIGPDVCVEAVCVSRSGRRVAAVGSAPGHRLTVWDAKTARPLPLSIFTQQPAVQQAAGEGEARGSAQASGAEGDNPRGNASAVESCIRLPGPISSLSFCPSDYGRIAASGPLGLRIFKLERGFGSYEVTTLAPVLPCVSIAAELTGAGPSTREVAAAAVAGAATERSSAAAGKTEAGATSRTPAAAASTRFLCDCGGDANPDALLLTAVDPHSSPNGAGEPVDLPPSATAASADNHTITPPTPRRCNANCWIAHAWVSPSKLVGITAAGDVAVICADTGDVLQRVRIGDVAAAAAQPLSSHALMFHPNAEPSFALRNGHPGAGTTGKAGGATVSGSLASSLGLFATSLVITKRSIVCGCSDGVVRFLSHSRLHLQRSVKLHLPSVSLPLQDTLMEATAPYLDIVGGRALVRNSASPSAAAAAILAATAPEHPAADLTISRTVHSPKPDLSVASLSLTPSCNAILAVSVVGTMYLIPTLPTIPVTGYTVGAKSQLILPAPAVMPGSAGGFGVTHGRGSSVGRGAGSPLLRGRSARGLGATSVSVSPTKTGSARNLLSLVGTGPTSSSMPNLVLNKDARASTGTTRKPTELHHASSMPTVGVGASTISRNVSIAPFKHASSGFSSVAAVNVPGLNLQGGDMSPTSASDGLDDWHRSGPLAVSSDAPFVIYELAIPVFDFHAFDFLCSVGDAAGNSGLRGGIVSAAGLSSLAVLPSLAPVSSPVAGSNDSVNGPASPAATVSTSGHHGHGHTHGHGHHNRAGAGASVVASALSVFQAGNSATATDPADILQANIRFPLAETELQELEARAERRGAEGLVDRDFDRVYKPGSSYMVSVGADGTLRLWSPPDPPASSPHQDFGGALGHGIKRLTPASGTESFSPATVMDDQMGAEQGKGDTIGSATFLNPASHRKLLAKALLATEVPLSAQFAAGEAAAAAGIAEPQRAESFRTANSAPEPESSVAGGTPVSVDPFFGALTAYHAERKRLLETLRNAIRYKEWKAQHQVLVQKRQLLQDQQKQRMSQLAIDAEADSAMSPTRGVSEQEPRSPMARAPSFRGRSLNSIGSASAAGGGVPSTPVAAGAGAVGTPSSPRSPSPPRIRAPSDGSLGSPMLSPGGGMQRQSSFSLNKPVRQASFRDSRANSFRSALFGGGVGAESAAETQVAPTPEMMECERQLMAHLADPIAQHASILNDPDILNGSIDLQERLVRPIFPLIAPDRVRENLCPLRITSLTAHRRLPIVAVGASDGSVVVLLVVKDTRPVFKPHPHKPADVLPAVQPPSLASVNQPGAGKTTLAGSLRPGAAADSAAAAAQNSVLTREMQAQENEKLAADIQRAVAGLPPLAQATFEYSESRRTSRRVDYDPMCLPFPDAQTAPRKVRSNAVATAVLAVVSMRKSVNSIMNVKAPETVDAASPFSGPASESMGPPSPAKSQITQPEASPPPPVYTGEEVQTDIRFRVLHRDFVHKGAVDFLCFLPESAPGSSPGGQAGSLLFVSMSSSDRTLVISDAGLVGARQTQSVVVDKTSGEKIAVPLASTAARAVANLPTADAFHPTSLAWAVEQSTAAATIFVGTKGGFLLSLSLPTLTSGVQSDAESTATDGASSNGPADISSSVLLRAHLPSAVVSLTATAAVPPAEPFPAFSQKGETPGHPALAANAPLAVPFGPCGEGAVLAALANEKDVAVIPYDPWHMMTIPVSTSMTAKEAEHALSTLDRPVAAFIPGHKKPLCSVQVSPIASSPAHCMLATTATDGTACVWAINLGFQKSSFGPGTEVEVIVDGKTSVPAGGKINEQIVFSGDGRSLFVASKTSGSLLSLAVASTVAELAERESAKLVPYSANHGPTAITAVEQTAFASFLRALKSDESVLLLSALPSRPFVACGALERSEVTIVPARVAALLSSGAEGETRPEINMLVIRRLQERMALAIEALSEPEHKKVRELFANEVATFRKQLQRLLLQNDNAPEDERLERKEFVIDEVGFAKQQAMFDARVAARKAAHEQECEMLDAAIVRLREACWETVQAHGAEITGIVNGELNVRNYPVKKRLPQESDDMARVALMRRLEQIDILRRLMAQGQAEGSNALVSLSGAGALPEGAVVNARMILWPELSNRIAHDSDWLFLAGLLPPAADPVASLENVAHVRANAIAKAQAAAAAASQKAESKKNAHEDGEDDADHNEGSSGEGAGATAGGDHDVEPWNPEAMLAELSSDGSSVAWEGSAIFNLLYHPAAVRSPAQKRAQIRMVKELVRTIQLNFNQAFDALRMEKLEVLGGISTRNARLREILTDLGEAVFHLTASSIIQHEAAPSADLAPLGKRAHKQNQPKQNQSNQGALGKAAQFILRPGLERDHAVRALLAAEGMSASETSTHPIKPTVGPHVINGVSALIDPFLCSMEAPEATLQVTEDEVGCSPYLSPEELRRREDEKDLVRRDAERKKDDAPGRALDEMMGGTLSGKDELERLEKVVAQAFEPWMATEAEADMTPEYKSLYAGYMSKKAALEEERANRRNALNGEATKLTTEIRELVHSFEEKTAALAKKRVGTQSAVLALELYASRLAVSCCVRQEIGERDRQLEASWLRLVPEEAQAAAAYDSYRDATEALAAEIEALTARDKALEKGFREQLKETVMEIAAEMNDESSGQASAVLDPEVQKLVALVFRKRLDTSAPSPGGHGAHGVPHLPESLGSPGMALPNDPFAIPGTLPTEPYALIGESSRVPKSLTGLSMTEIDPVVAEPGLIDWRGEAAAIDADALNERRLFSVALKSQALAPLSKSDLPEGTVALMDNPPVWKAVNRLRDEKIMSELDIAAKTARLARMRKHLSRLTVKYDAQKARIDRIDTERDTLALAKEVDTNDSYFIARFRLGQDEVPELPGAQVPPTRVRVKNNTFSFVPATPVMVDYSDGLLVPTNVIDSTNEEVRLLGNGHVTALTNIRDFRRTLLYAKWEKKYLTATVSDLEDTIKDLQLMRAAGSVGEYVKGVNIAGRARLEADRGEARIAYMKTAHVKNLGKLSSTTQKLDTQVKDRKQEVSRLEKHTRELEDNVRLRESILRTRGALSQKPAPQPSAQSAVAAEEDEFMQFHGTAQSSAPAATTKVKLPEKMQTLISHARLAHVSKVQADEISKLREELERLRNRSYPAFPAEPAKFH
jgi:hypothetical protein